MNTVLEGRVYAPAPSLQTKGEFIMASFNKIAIVGYLGRDPELRYTPQGTAVCNLSVATTEKRKDSAGELHEITTWFQVAFFGRQAEVITERLSKGSHVWLEGSLSLNQWTDKEGATRGSLEVRGSDIRFLSPAGVKARVAGTAAGTSAEDEVPF
jgi:single-strand DNA-binding protein